MESVCSALGLLTCKYNRQEKRLYSQAIGLKREQTDSNSHASCHTTSLSVVLSLQSTIISDTFLTTLRNPNNQRIHLFLEVFSVLLLRCICQYSGPAILKKLNICDIRVILVGVVAYHKQKTKECVVCEKWSPTESF